MRKERLYSYWDREPPCASCGTGSDEVQDVRECIEECYGDKEIPEWFKDWKDDLSKSCVFHIGCWRLLIQHFNNGVVPLDKLAKVVKEAPWPQYRAYHVIPDTGTPSSRCFRYIGFRAESKTFPKAENMECEHPLKDESQVNDCFRLLPLEIRFEIAYLLPTPEYLSLRLASKAMVHIFENQEFWKTRFFIHRERGYLNYLLEEGCGDWRLMYRCTSRLKRLARTLRFRRLQWLHNEWIKDRCMMIGAPISTSPENAAQFDGLVWERAAGKVQCDRPYKSEITPPSSLGNDICQRCRGVHNLLPPQMVTISSELVEIAVSVLAEDEHSFITGLNLVYGESSPSISLGYQISQKQIKIDLRGQPLKGFEVLAGEGGIQAIRPIFDQKHGISRSMIGKPNATCKSVLLNPDGEIKAFAGYFDHCRMRDAN
ncbi:hypothetical protein DTO013E5_3682 [Penicillium roqueforti]|nr:hypothetical protein DTO012A1_3691 [Penicillium roqueforti]KAI2752435.1 hypothetical protein DTO013F2_3238 [Penicillium roqueforti]KAI3213769.1 hypothetical protein DTO013E5_3682 [Penicillium roqueforti]